MTVSPADTRDSRQSQDAAPAADETPAAKAGRPSPRQIASDQAFSGTRQQPGGEEPDMALEPDLPSDGRDPVGEAMIRDLPQRPELSEPPSQPDPSSQPT